MNNLTYLFTAYAAIWTLLFLFFLSSSKKLIRLAKEVEALKKQIGKTGE